MLGPNNFYHIFYDYQTKQIKKLSEIETTIQDFEKSVTNSLDQRYIDQDYYNFVLRTPSRNENEMNRNVYTKETWIDKKSMSANLDPPCILQQYIYSKQKYASITRVCYKTNNNNSSKSSYGFWLTNVNEIFSDKAQLTYNKKATICKDFENSFECHNVSQQALQEYCLLLQNLVDFLELEYKQRVTEIVADFITDQFDNKILFNVKEILTDLIDQKINKGIQLKKMNRDQLSCSVYCKLCGLFFKKDQANKILTYKLLYEFISHLKIRGTEIKDIDVSHSSTRQCRVCDTCFTTVVSEHELINLEKEFAQYCNIEYNENNFVIKEKNQKLNWPALLKDNLYQWRIMIFIQKIQFDKNMESLFDLLNKDFNIQMSINKVKHIFQLKGIENQKQLEIKLLKVFYVFTESLNLSQFLNESELEIELKINDKRNQVIFQGETLTLKKFIPDFQQGQKHEQFIYLFDSNNKFITLKMIIGLYCDNQMGTQNINLYKTHGAYIPDNDYFSKCIFPSEWIEIFKSKPLEENNNQLNKDIYKPLCWDFELDKMLNGRLKQKSKYSNMEYSNISNINHKFQQSKLTENKKSVQLRAQSAINNFIQRNRNFRESNKIQSSKFNFETNYINKETFYKINSEFSNWINNKQKDTDFIYQEYIKEIKELNENE